MCIYLYVCTYVYIQNQCDKFLCKYVTLIFVFRLFVYFFANLWLPDKFTTSHNTDHFTFHSLLLLMLMLMLMLCVCYSRVPACLSVCLSNCLCECAEDNI